MDQELREIFRENDYEKAVVSLRRAGKTGLLAHSPLNLSARAITYIYRLRHKGTYDKPKYVYGETPQALIQELSQEIDRQNSHGRWNGRFAITELGYDQQAGGLFVFREGGRGVTPASNWKLSRVPTLEINGHRILLSKTPMTPYFQVKNIDILAILKQVGEASARISSLNQETLERQRAANQARAEENRVRSMEQLRQQRLRVFKEALKSSQEAALAYRNSIKGDEEFIKITQLLLDRISPVATETETTS